MTTPTSKRSLLQFNGLAVGSGGRSCGWIPMRHHEMVFEILQRYSLYLCIGTHLKSQLLESSSSPVLLVEYSLRSIVVIPILIGLCRKTSSTFFSQEIPRKAAVVALDVPDEMRRLLI
jgi:hypothetical protein